MSFRGQAKGEQYSALLKICWLISNSMPKDLKALFIFLTWFGSGLSTAVTPEAGDRLVIRR